MQLQELKKMMADSSKRGDTMLRAIANYANWYLVVDENNCAILWEFDGKQTLGVMTERKSPDKKTYQYLEMRGRHLMNNLPDETQMICFDLSQENSLYLNEDGVARLKNIALALNCEEAVAAPQVPSTPKDLNDNVDRILNHEWIVLWNDKQPLVMPYKGIEGVMLFTAFDTIDAFLAKQPDPTNFYLAHMSGSKLFELLDKLDNYDGVYINAESDLELFPFAPAQINDLANGRQPRPERKILHARSQAEIDHFLDESSMATERPSKAEEVNGQSVVHYTGETIPGIESRSFRFHPVGASSSDSKWGDGPTEIICGGKLADLLRRRMEIIESEPKPLDKNLKGFVQTAILWANELSKLIEPQTGNLPRSVLRTVDGARFIREYPEIGTRKFADESLTKLKALIVHDYTFESSSNK